MQPLICIFSEGNNDTDCFPKCDITYKMQDMIIATLKLCMCFDSALGTEGL